ncbi:MutS-related protein [Compostibacter hankyongensis]|uniref:MutS family DNA mismatch repair protein n=1 Tax=Compostibacter hankyongensis TaxID=1007089 RepID=A0ABP8G600_9BACT
MNPEIWYRQQLEKLEDRALRLRRRNGRLAAGRLLSFAGGILLFFVLLPVQLLPAVILLLLCWAIFAWLAIKDSDSRQQLSHIQVLKKCCEEELQSLSGDQSAFDDGAGFRERDHPYTADLDIFGPSSLFQYLYRGTSPFSAACLADWLSGPATPEDIRQRQEAVAELQPLAGGRLELRARGRSTRLQPDDWQRIRSWIAAEADDALPAWSRLTRVLPWISLGAVFLIAFTHSSWQWLWLPLLLHAWLARQVNKTVSPAYRQLSRSVDIISSTEAGMMWMEAQTFRSACLQTLKGRCRHGEENAAFILRRLKNILDRLDYRQNPLVHLPLNLVTFWDARQYRELLTWKRQYGAVLLQWTRVLAETEALCSFANFAFNRPGVVFPELSERHFTLEATALGHPLLPDGKCVRNDVAVQGAGQVLLVTGSNMAGKSTFLRTVGTNIVLALAGAPVCADRFRVSPVKVYSSMRIADNLEENISTFYAELRKLEVILQQVRIHEKVFLLLDEIFRGTNSQDRHTGSRALISQLLRENTAGIIATHDLALTSMEQDYPGKLHNYHFDVQVRDEVLFFDYKLKTGICTSMNASLLMRKIGLELPPQAGEAKGKR